MHTTTAGSESLIERLRRATIGRYDIYAELGSGGMASVFLALDLALDRKVAIKVMSPALTNSPDALERFKREAKVSAALSHPNIIPVYAVGEDPELAFFVMKFIEGRSLDSVIRDSGAQSVEFAQAIISASGLALHYAHQRGVVHRDVKPANFMLDQDGWLVVTDFGIAKMEDGHGLTMSGTLIGTPYYMSPEQFNGKAISGSSDQYALGVVAYELLTGQTPYHGPTIAEVMRGHLIDDVPPIRSVRPEVPVALEQCISRMLAKTPAERFPTLADAVAAFGAVPPSAEVAVRTQIISLAKSGALAQPRMSVPLSPIPQRRPSRVPAKTEARPSAGAAAPAFDSNSPTPKIAQRPVPSPTPATRRSALRWMVPVGAILAAGGVAWIRPDLVGLGARRGQIGGSPPAVVSPSIPQAPDSAALAAAAAAAATPPPVVLVDTAPKTSPAAPKVVAKPAAKPKASTTAKPEPPPVVEAKPPEPEPVKPVVVEPVPQPAPIVRVETLMVAAPPPPAPEPAPVPTGPGFIRIGSRIPLGALLINGDTRVIGGSRGILTIEVPSGQLRVTIRSDNCVDWDTTFVVVPRQTHTIGNRSPRCPP